MDELTRQRVKRLRQYAAWEEEHYPDDRLHVLDWAAGEIERLRAENERLRRIGRWYNDRSPVHPSPDEIDQTNAELAPAQLVDVTDRKGRVTRLRADQVEWSQVVPYGGSYRPALSASGLPLCSAEGLEPWATHVATDNDGLVWQYSQRPVKPEWSETGWHPVAGRWRTAPSTHRRPGPVSESLMEVWRD